VASGVSKVPTWRFAVLNILGAVIWAGAFSGAGYVFGEALHNLIGRGHHAGRWTLYAAGALVVIVLFVWLARYALRLRHKSVKTPSADA
jgi:membrane protein DedA with SNARE-associated domain